MHNKWSGLKKIYIEPHFTVTVIAFQTFKRKKSFIKWTDYMKMTIKKNAN